jgi:hypothetical protein
VFVPPTQAPNGDQLPSLQVRVAVPLQLQVCEDGPLHEQAPQLQSAPQLCDPPAVPQVRVALGWHCPSLEQDDQVDQVPVLVSQIRVWVPQLPHGWDEAPLHCCPPQASHLQSAPHDCVPPLPHGWVVPAAHSFSPAHADQSDHCPVAQVRLWVPHRPHACEPGPMQPPFPSAETGASATTGTSAAPSPDAGATSGAAPAPESPSSASAASLLLAASERG